MITGSITNTINEEKNVTMFEIYCNFSIRTYSSK